MKCLISDHAWVRLTPDGMKVYEKYREKLKNNIAVTTGGELPAIEKDRHGFIEFKLSDLMKIFGSHCEIGKPDMFSENEVHFAPPLF